LKKLFGLQFLNHIPMLGTIYDHWDKSMSVPIMTGDKFVFVRGKRLEVKLELNNHLRLSLVETQDNRGEQHHQAVSNVMNKLKNHRKELATIKHELKEIFSKLANDDLEEDEWKKLFEQVRAKRAIRKKHEEEINKLVDQTAVSVSYRVVKTGVTAVLPPGLTLHPKFLPEPVCWCPYDMPASHLVEKTTPMVEKMPLISASDFTASGPGLEHCVLKQEARFVVTAKAIEKQLLDVNCDNFLVESKEAEIESTISRKDNGNNEVTYVAASEVQHCKQFSLAVTLFGQHIKGSPFSVLTFPVKLMEFSTSGSHSQDWQDPAVKIMSSVSNARLTVQLFNVNGSEVYKATGTTKSKWTPNHITAPNNKQYFEALHTNVIELDNGDRMMIIGKNGVEKDVGSDWGYDIYRSNNIVINVGWTPNLKYKHPRRLIIALSAPGVPGWTAPGNLISFSKSGFIATFRGNWPKFEGTFRISYMPL